MQSIVASHWPTCDSPPLAGLLPGEGESFLPRAGAGAAELKPVPCGAAFPAALQATRSRGVWELPLPAP